MRTKRWVVLVCGCKFTEKKRDEPMNESASSDADNAHMESFFHTLKAEVIHGVRFDSVRTLMGVLNQYLGRNYNHRRMHSALGYCSPAEYEAFRHDQRVSTFSGEDQMKKKYLTVYDYGSGGIWQYISAESKE